MGGLFSTEEPQKPQPPRRNIHYDYDYDYRYEDYEPPYRPPTTTYRSSGRISTETSDIYSSLRYGYNNGLTNTQINDLTARLGSVRVSGGRETSRSIRAPERSKLNMSLFNLYAPVIVTFVDLEPDDDEYRIITGKITNKQNFKVDGIQKIVNPYLEKAYQLKKAQRQQQYGYVEEELLFHGTKQANMGAICKMNFNWRLCEQHKYGKGISFSPNSTYASNYSDEHAYNKVMLVVKVLIGRRCLGDKRMELPPNGFDTTQKDEGIVTVKFEDNEFLPMYKINYHLKNKNTPRKRYGKRKQGGTARSPQSLDTSFEYYD